jgi:hypothetical protein
VRSLAPWHVFTYGDKPLQRITRSFQTALRDAGIVDFAFTTCGTVPQRTSGGQGWTR